LQTKKIHKAASIQCIVGILNTGSNNQVTKLRKLKKNFVSSSAVVMLLFVSSWTTTVSLSVMYHLSLVSLEKRYKYRFIVSQILIQDTVLNRVKKTVFFKKKPNPVGFLGFYWVFGFYWFFLDQQEK